MKNHDSKILYDRMSPALSSKLYDTLRNYYIALPHASIQQKLFTLPTNTYLFGDDQNPSQLYIREEWLYFINRCENIWNKKKNVIILGTPGIGKTQFIAYLMYHLIHKHSTCCFVYQTEDSILCIKYVQKQLTMIYTTPDNQSIVNHSVYEELLDPRTYYMLDGLCPKRVDIKARIILVSSPKAQRWRQFSKHEKVRTTVMKPWEYDELVDARNILGIDIELAVLEERFRILGRTFRNVLTNYSNDDEDTDPIKVVDTAIKQCDVQQTINSNGEQVGSHEQASSILIHLIPHESRNYHDTMYTFATHYVGTHVLKKLQQQYAEHYKSMLRHAGSNLMFSTMTGRIFEEVAHGILAAGGIFQIRLLTNKKRGRPSNQVNQQQVKRSLGNQSQTAAGDPEEFSVNSHTTTLRSTLTLDCSGITEINNIDQVGQYVNGNTSKYMLPVSKSFESIDSMVFPNQLFQMTVNESHGINVSGLLKVIRGLDQDIQHYNIYMVVPEYKFENYPAQSYDLKNLTSNDKEYWNKFILPKVKQYGLSIPIDISQIEQ